GSVGRHRRIHRLVHGELTCCRWKRRKPPAAGGRSTAGWGEFGGTVVGDAVESLAAAALEGVGTVVGVMTTQWVFVDTIDLASEDGIEGGIADGQPVDYVSPAHAGMDLDCS